MNENEPDHILPTAELHLHYQQTDSNSTLFLAPTLPSYGAVYTVLHLTVPPHPAVSDCQLQSADHQHPALMQSVSIAVPGTQALGDNSIQYLHTHTLLG